MPKFPTETEYSVTVKRPMAEVYEHLWDVVGTTRLIPGLDSCKALGGDRYHFQYEEKSSGPISLVVRYTAQYEGNGKNEITYKSIGGKKDNTDVEGTIHLRSKGTKSTEITLHQMMAPEMPVPRLLQPLVRPIVQREATDGLRAYLEAVKQTLEA